MNKTGIQLAVAAAGSQSELARRLKVRQGQVWKWLQSGQIPAPHVIPAEKATGVSRHVLRPDVFGPAPEQQAAP